MFNPIDFKPVKEWPDLDSFIRYLKEQPGSPLFRLLLTSGGMLTQSLKALLLSPIHMEIVSQILTKTGLDSGRFLGIPGEEKAYFREIWLLNDRKEKIVYASSFLPLNRISPEILQEIRLRTRLIGEIVDASSIPATRDRMSFSMGQSAGMAAAFGFPVETLVWSRRYRLLAEGNLLADIREIFSPSLFIAQ